MENRTQAPARIGYLSGSHVLCMDCAPAAPRDMVPVYSENIGRYNQSCHLCSEPMQLGDWNHCGYDNYYWPELWDRKDCRQCQ